MKCLEKKPENRYPDVAAFAHALEKFAPARSAISIERIAKVIGSPSSSGQFSIITSDAFFPRAVSASAPTLSEEDLVQRETMPMPPPNPRMGAETMTNATLSVNRFLANRKQRRTATYGAAGFIAVCALVVATRSHSHASAVAETSSPQPSAPVIAAVDVASATLAPIALEGAGPAVAPISAKTLPFVMTSTPVTMASAPLAPPSASTIFPAASASAHPHKRNQDLSKLFGGRD
jgi:hypothetical protein